MDNSARCVAALKYRWPRLPGAVGPEQGAHERSCGEGHGPPAPAAAQAGAAEADRQAVSGFFRGRHQPRGPCLHELLRRRAMQELALGGLERQSCRCQRLPPSNTAPLHIPPMQERMPTQEHFCSNSFKGGNVVSWTCIYLWIKNKNNRNTN